jgi:hypothetical protein
MTGSAQRPEKPESRDGCVSRMLSLQLQKSPTPDFEGKCGHSPDISKGISQLGIYNFDSSEVELAVLACSGRTGMEYSYYCKVPGPTTRLPEDDSAISRTDKVSNKSLSFAAECE